MTRSLVNADLDRAETWYRHEPLVWSVVPVHHPQAFWDVRQWPAVHEAFASLWGTEKLWVSMDRGVFKVPRSDEHPFHVDESRLHWDIDPRTPSSRTYQGMLFLTDATRGEGSFECVPSIFRELDRYLDAHPAGALDVPVDLAGHRVVEVPVRAGDLVIWSARLPHQGGPNRGARPRVSLAVRMEPEGSDADREERIASWQQRRAPAFWRRWKGQVDPEPRGTRRAHTARSPTRRNRPLAMRSGAGRRLAPLTPALAPGEGLEPPTPRSEVWCSIH